MLYNLGKFLSIDQHVTICLRGVTETVRKRLAWNQYFSLIAEQELPNKAKFDVALFHLPFGGDEFLSKISFRHSALVVMEIQSRHTIQLSMQEAKNFQKVIYLHDEQLLSIQRLFKKNQCYLLPIINNVDFDLPFQKTDQIASIGVWQYKHNMAKVLSILKNSALKIKFKLYSERPPTLRELGLMIPGYYYQAKVSKRLVFSGLEWNPAKIYSGFDCLLHLPSEGNGTSIVVSDALACGKLVVLSSLKGYKEAYSKFPGVHFIDDLGDNLGDLLQNFNKIESIAIKKEYQKHYCRSDVLMLWKETLLS